jgi:hypothetical protein
MDAGACQVRFEITGVKTAAASFDVVVEVEPGRVI